MLKKGGRIRNGETPLPEALIHHIQSFLTGKEAARSSILSKSWYHASLTRPSIDLDFRNFSRQSSINFLVLVNKTIQRYQDSALKIQSLKLNVEEDDIYPNHVDEMIVNAIKIGATRLQLVLPDSVPLELALADLTDNPISLEELSIEFPHLSSPLILPQELLIRCQNLVTLSLTHCKVDGKFVISCSALKSMTLYRVTFTDVDMFKDMITSCISMESLLSLSSCHHNGFRLRVPTLYELRKLRRLFLRNVSVDNMFFTDFRSRFPCLNDLSIHGCPDCTEIQIVSTSLERISFKPDSESWRAGRAEFDVPNIRSFSYSGPCLLNKLFIKASLSREWEFDLSLSCHDQFFKSWWFVDLKEYLTKCGRLARISLSMRLMAFKCDGSKETSVTPEPLVVENLMIDAPSSYCCALLVHLFGICRPKFITHEWLCRDGSRKNVSLDILSRRLITPESGLPDQSMFGKFNLKKVNVEVYEMFYTEWRPLVLEEPLDATKTPERRRKVRFELIWD